MQNDFISIGKMAAIQHITVATLRLYDKLGLIKPAFTDPDTGYRYYSPEQSARLDMISYMKELGMSLEEIASVLRQEDIMLIEEILIRKNEQVNADMHMLKNQRDAIERAIASIERYRKSPVTGTISLEYIDRRFIWGISCSRNFYETGIKDFEFELSELRSRLNAKGVSHVHTYNVGTSILMSDYLRGYYRPHQVFIFADERFHQWSDKVILDRGMYACLYLDGFEKEKAGAERLLDYCRTNHYQISGDYLCEVMTEFNVFESTRRNMYMRLQVPVMFTEKKIKP